MLKKSILRVVGAGLLAGFCASAAAQQEDLTLTADELGLTDAQLNNLLEGTATTGGSPGVSFGSPVGFGANWGVVGVGVGGSVIDDRIGDDDQDVDGSAGIVVGLGDSRRFVGVELSANVISLQNDFGDDGNFGVKLHRLVGERGSFAVGVENLGAYGQADFNDESYYAAYSQVFTLPNAMPVVLTGGLGNERFSNSRNDDGVGAFGAAAILLNERLSTIVDYAGQNLGTALSFTPIRAVPLTVTAGFTNVNSRNGNDPQFSGGIGYSYTFRQ